MSQMDKKLNTNSVDNALPKTFPLAMQYVCSNPCMQMADSISISRT